MRYTHDSIPICPVCEFAPEGLISVTKSCERCGISFCSHFASNTDVRMCGNCLDDFRIVESVETKITQHVDEEGNVLSQRRQIARNLKLTGTDWLFAAAKISTLNDEEMDASIEYHRAIFNSLLEERELRRKEYFNKVHNIKKNLSIVDRQLRDHKLNADLANGKVVKVKEKTAQKKQDKSISDIASLLVKLGGPKIDSDALAQMLKNLAAGVPTK